MPDSIFFDTPILIIGFVLALALMLFELRTKSTGYVCPALSALITIGMIIYGLFKGATYQELVIIIAIFVVITLVSFKIGGEK